MKKIIISAIVTSLSITCFSQSSLYVSAGTNFFISSGTSVTIDSLQLKPTANFNIIGLNSTTRDATATSPPPSAYIQRVFHFLQTTSHFSGDITFYYRDAELNGLAENTLNLSIYDGTTWAAYPPSQRDAVNNFVTRLGLGAINLNELTLTAPGAVVPVTLSRFSIQNNSCTALLKWTTASEQNSKHFEVQHSTDAINFSVIKIIASNGNSNIERQYNYNASLNGKTNYFRLRIVDVDGQSKISEIISVTSNCNNNNITVYPNPTKNTATINGLTGTTQLRVLDQLGQVISATTTANASATINLLHVAAGTYIVQVLQNNKEVKNIKIIKE